MGNISRKLFSIEEGEFHKIIRIFGIKFSIKDKKKIFRCLQNVKKISALTLETSIYFNNSKRVDNIEEIFSNNCVISRGLCENSKYLFNGNLQYLNKIYDLPKYAIVWGSGAHEEAADIALYSMQHNIPLIRAEDGFLRSADTWCNKTVDRKYTDGISFTFTDSVHYFDATCESKMERLLNDKSLIISDEQKQRARKCIDKIVETHLTKYNHQPVFEPKIGRDGVKKILVVDQSYGDFSISRGLASDKTFENMLQAAINENPDADIIVKTHPDAIAKGTLRPKGYYTGLKASGNIYTMTEAINPISLIQYVDKVYVCTTQLGFEALMCGKEVHTFGMPFYAGWGVTCDRQVCNRRTNKRTLEEIFYIAYIIYSYYVNPKTKKQCEIEEAIEYLLELREEYRKYLGAGK